MTTTAPALDSAIEHFKAAEGALKDISSSANALRSTQDELSDTRKSVSAASEQLERSSTSWNHIAARIHELTGQVGEAAELLKEAQPEALRAEVESHGATIEELNSSVSTFETAVRKLQDEVGATSKTITGGLAAATDQIAGLRTRMSDELASVNSQIGRSADAIADLDAEIKGEGVVAAGRHEEATTRVERVSDAMDVSLKHIKFGFLTVGILSGASLAGTAYLIIQSFG